MQKQLHQITIQEVLEDALQKILGITIPITAAGRTDTGVHAKKMVAHFDYPENLDDVFIKRINRFLPQSISILKIEKVNKEAHARFHAIQRTYNYHIITHKNPFFQRYNLYVYETLDIEKMNKAASILKEYDDFKSFEKKHSDNKTSICIITEAYWFQNNEEIIFQISADRFLRNMVRSITGTLLEVGKGKKSIDDFREIIEKKDRKFAGNSVAAKALFLTDIVYPENVYIKNES